jgi:acetyl-CoA carboxylase carboxyltransferase component
LSTENVAENLSEADFVWGSELRELEQRRRMARQLGGQDAVARHHSSGRLTARERIDQLVDEGTFREFGQLAGTARYEGDNLVGVVPASPVMGRATIGGRTIAVTADDFTVKGGSSDASIQSKWTFIERWALESRKPLVRLVDAAGGSVRTIERTGATVIPGYDFPGADLLRTVPVASAALGPCAGFGAVKVVLSHYSVMVAGVGQVFAGGPRVVAAGVGQAIGKEELGGSRVHARRTGVADDEAADEPEAFARIRAFLSYLPTSVYALPPMLAPTDSPDRREDWLASAVPRDPRKPYDMRALLDAIVDRDSVFEIGRRYGRSAITALARFGGRTVGVLSSDPRRGGGGLTATAADKLCRFVDLCDTFHVPIVSLVDQPGVYIGAQAELDGTIRRALRARLAIAQSRVPWCAVFVRRAFGVGGAMYAPLDRAVVRYAWPSANWGSVPVAGGVQAAHRREIEDAADPKAYLAELEERYHSLESPFRTAERFGVEEVIDPRETRERLCEWIHDSADVLAEQLGPRDRGYRV